ncbi:MAG: hypothetical protein M3N13_10980 [Candidatus Eremiobacteraeota bacterium]|nr:hypothetical protein [Candidatus Eremiobacteraeota bacterium]
MKAVARPSCATPGPNFQYVDANTGDAISSVYDTSLSAVTALGFGLGGVTVHPMIPVIVSSLTLPVHDFAQLAILPDGADAEATLTHINYVDNKAAAMRHAQETGTAIPPDNKTDDEIDKAYLKNVVPRLADETLGSNYDDQYFQNDDGDPNSADPHKVSSICRYVSYNTKYTLILRWLSRIQKKDANFQKTQTTLTDAHAPADSGQNVGWIPKADMTYVAKGVQPTLVVPWIAGDSTKLGFVAHAYSSSISWKFFNQINLLPAGAAPNPSPTASSSPTPNVASDISSKLSDGLKSLPIAIPSPSP